MKLENFNGRSYQTNVIMFGEKKKAAGNSNETGKAEIAASGTPTTEATTPPDSNTKAKRASNKKLPLASSTALEQLSKNNEAGVKIKKAEVLPSKEATRTLNGIQEIFNKPHQLDYLGYEGPAFTEIERRNLCASLDKLIELANKENRDYSKEFLKIIENSRLTEINYINLSEDPINKYPRFIDTDINLHKAMINNFNCTKNLQAESVTLEKILLNTYSQLGGDESLLKEYFSWNNHLSPAYKAEANESLKKIQGSLSPQMKNSLVELETCLNNENKLSGIFEHLDNIIKSANINSSKDTKALVYTIKSSNVLKPRGHSNETLKDFNIPLSDEAKTKYLCLSGEQSNRAITLEKLLLKTISFIGSSESNLEEYFALANNQKPSIEELKEKRLPGKSVKKTTINKISTSAKKFNIEETKFANKEGKELIELLIEEFLQLKETTSGVIQQLKAQNQQLMRQCEEHKKEMARVIDSMSKSITKVGNRIGHFESIEEGEIRMAEERAAKIAEANVQRHFTIHEGMSSDEATRIWRERIHLIKTKW